MLNIAIDGHVASGKSVLAKAIASNLGIKVFETGAIYRGLACAFKETGHVVNFENVEKFIQGINVKVEFIEGIQHVIVNGVDYTSMLRLEEISVLSSAISPFKNLRNVVLDIQRNFAKENDCVMEGRDIGTEILPNANVKFFVTASQEVRAQRRYDQIKDKSTTSYQHILDDLKLRDYRDENREVSPLKKAEDAILIDSSDMALEEVIEKCLKIVKEKQ